MEIYVYGAITNVLQDMCEITLWAGVISLALVYAYRHYMDKNKICMISVGESHKKYHQWTTKQKQHSSQLKQHNRNNTRHKIILYSSVAILVRCWCSQLASVFAPCMLPLQFAADCFIFQHQPTYSQLVAYHGGHSRLHRMQRGKPKRGSFWWQVFVMPGEG